MFLRKYFSDIWTTFSLTKLLLVLACASPLGALAVPIYRMTLLPQDFSAAALNRAGLVVGTAQGGAAIWSPEATTYLGALLPGSQGLAINGSGAITGIAGDGAFVYAGGALSSFGLPLNTWATSINDGGQVAGFSSEAFGIRRGFVYAGGAFTDLPTFGGEISVANAINAGGQVAGYASVATDGDDWPDPQRYAALYSNGQGRNLGSLGGLVSEANDVSDSGFVAGWSTLADGIAERPFLFSPFEDSMRDLGTLGGAVARANALNNAGAVVGLSDIGGADGFDYHAFLYRAGGMADLNDLVGGLGDWRLVTATDINDAGQILAEACRDGLDECRAVRLDLVTPVPEPGVWALMAVGLAALLWHARRRARSGVHAGVQPEMQPEMQPDAGAPAAVCEHVRTDMRKDAGRRAPLAAAALGALLVAGPAVSAAQEAAAAAPAVTPAAPQQAPPAASRFRVTFLPPVLVASAINSRGHVVGYNGSAAVWDGSTLRDYAALAPGSAGYGINGRGDLAGGHLGAAHVFSPAGVRNVGRQILQGSSYAIALNDSGGVTGGSYFGVGERSRGFVLTAGVLRMIPSLGGDWSSAAAINRSGQVTGTAALEGDAIPEPFRHAFIFRDKTIVDIGTLGGRNSNGNDINDAGQVVGGAETGALDENGNPILRPFLYSGGAMQDLSVLGGVPNVSYGVANGLNNAGTVVGEYVVETPDGPASRAFLYEGGRMRDLNELTTLPAGWVLNWARDINDARQVLAQACGPQSCLYVRLDPGP